MKNIGHTASYRKTDGQPIQPARWKETNVKAQIGEGDHQNEIQNVKEYFFRVGGATNTIKVARKDTIRC